MLLESEALVLKATPHGDTSLVVTVLSAEHGKLRGLVKGGTRRQADFQPLNLARVTSQRRLKTQLGTLKAEVLGVSAAKYFNDPCRLHCLTYLAEVLDIALPDEEPHTALYERTRQFIADLDKPGLWQRLGYYELTLLLSIGYGLSLREEEAVPCPAQTPLTYVSPRSGRAVSAAVGRPFQNKLLPLPELFGGPERLGPEKSKDFLDVFRLTGHFLEKAVQGRRLDERRKLLDVAARNGFKD